MDMNRLNAILVNNIRKICKNKKVPITQMEEDLGFSPGLISRWSRTKTSPSFDKVVSVMKYLDVTYEELTGEGNITSVNFALHSKDRSAGSTNNIYEIVSKETINNQLHWKRTGEQLPSGISGIEDLFTDWYMYDWHKYYFTVIGQTLFILIVEYNTRTCQLYDSLNIIHYQLDGSSEIILEQDRHLLDLLHFIDEEDYNDICAHYKEHIHRSFEHYEYTNEPEFTEIKSKI